MHIKIYPGHNIFFIVSIVKEYLETNDIFVNDVARNRVIYIILSEMTHWCRKIIPVHIAFIPILNINSCCSVYIWLTKN